MKRSESQESAVIVGIDEAGRGALAGPVVAGAVVLCDALSAVTEPSGPPLQNVQEKGKGSLNQGIMINDSKQLLPEEREEAFAWIETHCTFGYGIVENIEVDDIGILGATEKAMHAALAMIEDHITPTYLLIDGRDKFWFNYPHSSVIRGDETEPCISAASIVAKVLRDRLMVQHGTTFPNYKFEDHKGYGAPQHLEALEMFGTCPLHRKTFLGNITCGATTLQE